MMTSDKNLIESRGYLIIKLRGFERAVKSPYVFGMSKTPKIENLTRFFLAWLKNQPVRVLSREALLNKSAEERDLLVLDLMKS